MDSVSKYRKITIVAGKTGYGKSYFVKNTIIPELDRVIIFDLLSEYNKENDFNNLGFIYFYDINSFQSYIAEHYSDDTLQIIITLEDSESYEFALQLSIMLDNVTIVIEEIANFTSAHSNSPELEKLIRFGRHKSISLVGITQRFSDVSLLLRDNLDNLIVFNLTAPNDINYLSHISYIGDRAEDITKLTRKEYLIFCND